MKPTQIHDMIVQLNNFRAEILGEVTALLGTTSLAHGLVPGLIQRILLLRDLEAIQEALVAFLPEADSPPQADTHNLPKHSPN